MKKLINQLDLSIDFSPMSADALALQYVAWRQCSAGIINHVHRD